MSVRYSNALVHESGYVVSFGSDGDLVIRGKIDNYPMSSTWPHVPDIKKSLLALSADRPHVARVAHFIELPGIDIIDESTH